jgi:hypothetical protein
MVFPELRDGIQYGVPGTLSGCLSRLMGQSLSSSFAVFRVSQR